MTYFEANLKISLLMPPPPLEKYGKSVEKMCALCFFDKTQRTHVKRLDLPYWQES